MRAKQKHRILKKLLSTIAVIVLCPMAVKLFVVLSPTITATAQKAALLSAGMGFMEGGVDYLKSEQYSTTKEQSALLQFGANNTGSIDDLLEHPDTAEPAPENAGPIKRTHYTAGTSSAYIQIAGNAYLKNATDVSADTIKSTISKQPQFQIDLKSEQPQVLIMHTHTTESYEPTTRDVYDKSYNSRTTDNTKNMVSVGNKIQTQLEAAGISVIHDTTLHDYPAYNGSYDRSAVTVQNLLKQYPSIKVVLDVHRDAIQQDDGTRIAPVAEVDGKNAAQVMIISGCDDGTMNHPNYLKNLRFAAGVQTQMEADYPGLTRPLLFAYKKYNQHLTTGSILLEMGAHANSLEEAQYAGELVGKSLAKYLTAQAKRK